MKVFIVLAVLSVAFANPFQAITLPQAPAPALEMVVELPKPALPMYQMPDIRPLIIPQEVMEALLAGVSIDTNDLADAVIFVDHAVEDVVPVRIVEVAENQAADIPLDLTPVEDTPVSGVIVVDHFDLSENALRQEEVQPVNFVDVAEESEIALEAVHQEEVQPVNFVDVAEESDIALEAVRQEEVQPVNFVDVAEESDIAPEAVRQEEVQPVNFVDVAEESEIVPEPVRFVDVPIVAESKVIDDQLTVKFVDAPIYTGKVYDNPMLR